MIRKGPGKSVVTGGLGTGALVTRGLGGLPLAGEEEEELPRTHPLGVMPWWQYQYYLALQQLLVREDEEVFLGLT